MTNQEKANGFAARLQAAERTLLKVYDDAIAALDEANASPEEVAAAEQAIDMAKLSIDLAHRLLANAANSVGDVTIQTGGTNKDDPNP